MGRIGRGSWAMVIAASLMTASVAPARPMGFDTAWRSMIDEYKAGATAEGIVGSTLTIAQDGRTLRTFHQGLADRMAGRAVDDNTLYHWASITKLFTAIAIMQLRDRGKLSLDDRIVDYLPEAKQIHNRFGPMSAITLRHLITHSSGLPGPTFPWRGEEGWKPGDWKPLEPAKWSQVAAMMPYTQIEFEPGSRGSYSNPGYSMLGRVVEEVTGDDIESYITKNILMPLGMTRSYFDTTPHHLQRHRSSSYHRTSTELRDLGPEVETGATSGNGGLNGPVADMVRFGNFLLGIDDNGNYDTVLSRKTLAEMWQPQFVMFERPNFTERMGHGFFVYEPVSEHGRMRLIGHTGGQQGFSSYLYVHPESRSVIVVATNTRDDLAPSPSAFGLSRRNIATKVIPTLSKRKTQ